LRDLLALAGKAGAAVRVIGAGSNVLVPDKGVRGLVIRLGSPYFKSASFSGCRLTAGSAAMLGSLIRESARRGLSGLEFLTGVPGTLGGALAMNAGAWGRNLGDLVVNVTVMDYNGKVKDFDRDQIKFAYRRSSVSKYIVLKAVLKLEKSANKAIKARAAGYLGQRRISQDNSFPNAGCVFKNPGGKSAGKLIDLCGLKGRSSGGARVSMRHANFILNYKGAKARDVLGLMSLAKKRVKARFNVGLVPEIKIWR